MTQIFALWSMIFMIGFVLVFDRVHRSGCIARFCREGLLSPGEIEQLRKIALACDRP